MTGGDSNNVSRDEDASTLRAGITAGQSSPPKPTIERKKDLKSQDVEGFGKLSLSTPNADLSGKAKLSHKNTKVDLSGHSETFSDGNHKQSPNPAALSIDDIKALFSGAPHFVLETEHSRRGHPRVFFPWNKELEFADLSDRRLIMHETFASSTLHAHLPVHGTPSSGQSPVSPTEKHHARKRPAFELGVFETPNMLASAGKEPGTVGMKTFLEIPLSDSLRCAETEKENNIAVTSFQLKTMSTTDAVKAMQGGENSMRIGKNAMWQDRMTFVRDRRSWKQLGIRDMSMGVIKARTAVITPWYNKMAREGWRRTILDETDSDTLYDELFTLMLYPARKASETPDQSLTVQIKELVNVLSTPGAWVDFSLVESRLHLGEYLWQSPEGSSSIQDPGAQRHWLLVQILLSVELAIRLDAALREQKIHHSEGTIIPEIQAFESFRTRKIDWDLVVARRFLDHIVVEEHAGAFPPATRPVMKKRQTSNVFKKWRQKMEDHESHADASNWDFVILPRDLDLQVEGLIRFAEGIRWSNMSAFEKTIRAKLQLWNSATSFAERKAFVGPLESSNPASPTGKVPFLHPPYGKNPKEETGLRVELLPASDYDSGGWLSRSWFASLILPGESISHLLIASLLEHDHNSLQTIGCDADLHGGFVFNDQSWWSKSCIVGKVTAAYDDGVECMGWIGTPHVHPIDHTGKPLSNRWLTIISHPVDRVTSRLRIYAGKAVADDSSPLGSGHGRVLGLDFLCAADHPPASTRHGDVRYEALILRSDGSGDRLSASIVFTISASAQTKTELVLKHDVHFVSAHPCRVPRMRAVLPHHAGVQACADEHESSHPEYLPGHLLHTSFRYIVKELTDLLSWGASDPYRDTDPGAGEICVIDARGEKAREVFARAWCSNRGRHAIVSRVGRTCLSCSVREARALDVGVVIRVGHLD